MKTLREDPLTRLESRNPHNINSVFSVPLW